MSAEAIVTWLGEPNDGCDGCGADIYHGEPHYGDCTPGSEGREL